jgi:hypothetical protein
MVLGLSKQSAVGIALILLGTVGFLPGMTSPTAPDVLLLAAVILLTLGTYLVGTDVQGAPV